MESVKSKESCRVKYPCLMVARTTGVIVLMSEYECGTKINGTAANGESVGFYYSKWLMSSLSEYNGSVCLEN